VLREFADFYNMRLAACDWDGDANIPEAFRIVGADTGAERGCRCDVRRRRNTTSRGRLHRRCRSVVPLVRVVAACLDARVVAQALSHIAKVPRHVAGVFFPKGLY